MIEVTMKLFQRLQNRLEEFQRRRDIDLDYMDDFMEGDKFARSVREAESPREVRALWIALCKDHFNLVDRTLGGYSHKNWTSGVQIILEEARAWDQQLVKDLLKVIKEEQAWEAAWRLAENPYLDHQSAQPLIDTLTAALKRANSARNATRRYSIQALIDMTTAINALAKRDWIPLEHPLCKQVREGRSNTDRDIFNFAALSLDILSLDELRQLDRRLQQSTEEVSRQLSRSEVRAPDDPDVLWTVTLMRLCEHAPQGELPRHWEKLYEFAPEYAIQLLGHLPPERRNHLQDSDALVPLLQHPDRKIREAALREAARSDTSLYR